MEITTLFSQARIEDIERACKTIDDFLKGNYTVRRIGPMHGPLEESDRTWTIDHYHLIGNDATVRVAKSSPGPHSKFLELDVCITAGADSYNLVNQLQKTANLSLPEPIHMQKSLYGADSHLLVNGDNRPLESVGNMLSLYPQ